MFLLCGPKVQRYAREKISRLISCCATLKLWDLGIPTYRYLGLLLGTGVTVLGMFKSWAPAWKHPRHKISCVVSGMDIGIRHLSTIGHIISNVDAPPPGVDRSGDPGLVPTLYRLHWIYVLLGDVSNE